jgi:APA family basic amino acid/polyamine antiporter
MSTPVSSDAPALVKGLGAWDAALVTIGSVLGTGIFITTADIARAVPHAGLILLLWVAGGLLTIAGALTYAELGAMFPRAGGQYEFLKLAYGPLWGFLFGWAAFFIIMSGGIATIAVGFGEYLGAFVPFFSTRNVLFSLPLGSTTWAVNGGQLAGALAIALLSAVNYVGLKEGAGLQNAVTIVKVASILGLAAFGLFAPSAVTPDLTAPLPQGSLLAALGVGMIAIFWSFDGWYACTNLGGEMRRPGRDLPLGIITGAAAVTLLYLLMNLVYVRALPVSAMAETGRIGEAAAQALFGSAGGKLITVAVLISSFGCISSTILYAARIYLPMAQDGVFFPALARIHPRYLTPSACITAQGAWSILLTFSGTYEQLYTYVMFAVVLFHALTAVAVPLLRRTRPDLPRPYRTWGYPWVPVLFILSSAGFVANTLLERPKESLAGLGLLLLGLPAYAFWRRRSAAAAPSPAVPADAG